MYSTSTPPMGRTVCTERQYLYKGALYLTFISLYLLTWSTNPEEVKSLDLYTYTYIYIQGVSRL